MSNGSAPGPPVVTYTQYLFHVRPVTSQTLSLLLFVFIAILADSALKDTRPDHSASLMREPNPTRHSASRIRNESQPLRQSAPGAPVVTRNL
jgi:hypothetical protein